MGSADFNLPVYSPIPATSGDRSEPGRASISPPGQPILGLVPTSLGTNAAIQPTSQANPSPAALPQTGSDWPRQRGAVNRTQLVSRIGHKRPKTTTPPGDQSGRHDYAAIPHDNPPISKILAGLISISIQFYIIIRKGAKVLRGND
ncbi:hypothetical protein QBC46DRAFT_354143 [Diplogelasinospora grovesii]|uniref:Uncharacterized protein n=1 Tax=Diplogelasinospora grovesii TaxID=303347 RepID=A0AAN6S564_9PEZI|nr:hypothetical protein QBC46DRAFT_354143 [Diplogelasinospora grovesii]